MGVPILVLGESGTGKSTSLRNFKKGEIAIVNVAGKPLPFKGSFESISGTTDFRKIKKFIEETKAKSIVVDDAQYIMSFQYMRRIKENGWDKFNELQSDFFNLIDLVKDLPPDVIVYFLSHLETKEDGRQKIKTIGKMLDEKITIEGMFTVVLKTYTADGKYFFLTQNSGNDTTKSPMGMFSSYAIDNDLKYVDDKIRNYYEMGLFLTDDEIKELDKIKENTDITKDDVAGKKRRNSRGKKDETSENEQPSTNAESKESEEKPARRRRNDNDKSADRNVDTSSGDNSTGDGNAAESESKESVENTDGAGRRRRSRNAVREEAAKEGQLEAAYAGIEEAGDKDEVSFDEINPPERKDRSEEEATENEEAQETTEAAEAPRRRRRRG